MKRYGYLFGVGAELASNLPSGGQYAVDIFTQDPAETKQKFTVPADELSVADSEKVI